MKNLAARLSNKFSHVPEQHKLTKFLWGEIEKGDMFPLIMSKEARKVIAFDIVCAYANYLKPITMDMVNDPDKTKNLFNLVVTDKLKEDIERGLLKMPGIQCNKKFWEQVCETI